jgi:hypothetical protein
MGARALVLLLLLPVGCHALLPLSTPEETNTPDTSATDTSATDTSTDTVIDTSLPIDNSTPQADLAPVDTTPKQDQGVLTWKVMSPSPGTSANFRDVWGMAGKLVVASSDGIWEHAAGTWTHPVTGKDFNAVRIDPNTGAGYAVGSFGAIYHHDNGTWVDTGSSGAHLSGVLVKGSSGIAVGSKATLKAGTSSSWTTVTSYPWPNNATLVCIWGVSTSDYWVGGYPPFWRYQNGQWLKGDFTASGTFNGMSGVGINEVYAVSTFGDIVRFDGAQWKKIHSVTNTTFYDIWARGSGDVFIVGTNGNIQHFNGASWTKMPVPSSTTKTILNGVWGTGTAVYAVGSSGTVLKLGP